MYPGADGSVKVEMGGQEEDEDQGRLFVEAVCAWLRLSSCVHLGLLVEGTCTEPLYKSCIYSIKIAVLGIKLQVEFHKPMRSC